MPVNPFPGNDALGFKDPTSIYHKTFPSTVERDAWVTAVGGTGQLPAGFTCWLVTPKQMSVWDGTAWWLSAAYT